MVLQLVHLVDEFFLIDRPNEGETLSDGEVSEDALLDLGRCLVVAFVLFVEAVLEIGIGGYLSVILILQLQHEIPQQPNELRHEPCELAGIG